MMMITVVRIAAALNSQAKNPKYTPSQEGGYVCRKKKSFVVVV